METTKWFDKDGNEIIRNTPNLNNLEPIAELGGNFEEFSVSIDFYAELNLCKYTHFPKQAKKCLVCIRIARAGKVGFCSYFGVFYGHLPCLHIQKFVLGWFGLDYRMLMRGIGLLSQTCKRDACHLIGRSGCYDQAVLSIDTFPNSLRIRSCSSTRLLLKSIRQR